MKLTGVFAAALFVIAALTAYASDDTADSGKSGQVKGVETVTDVVSSVTNKASALLSGNLEMKMELNENRAPKDEYTTNALGQRVPKNSALKEGGALHSE
jgi:hypothetical protein